MRSFQHSVVLWPLFAFISCLLLAIAFSPQSISSIASSPFATLLNKRSEVIGVLSFAYAVLAALLALLDFWLRKHNSSLALQTITTLCRSRTLVVDSWTQFMGTIRNASSLIWLFSALVIGLLARAYFLAQPIRFDEADTFLYFVNRGPQYLFYYPRPNNHVLHTLLVYILTSLMDPNTVSIRLVSFTFGLLAIPLAYGVSRLLFPGTSGLLTALGIAVSPYLILYSTIARGYSLIVAFTLLIILLGIVYQAAPQRYSTFPIALAASLGILTIPTMLFPLAGFMLWLLVMVRLSTGSWRTSIMHFAIPCGLLIGVLTLLFYTPVIVVSNGAEQLLGSEYVQSRDFGQFVVRIVPNIINAYHRFVRDVPLVLILLAAMSIIGTIVYAARRRNWSAVALLPAILVGTMIVLIAKRVTPHPRVYIFLLPVFALYIDYAPSRISSFFSSRMRNLSGALVVVLAFVLSLGLLCNNSIPKYIDVGIFPEAEAAIRLLVPELSPETRIHCKYTKKAMLEYYRWMLTGDAWAKKSDDGEAIEFWIVDTASETIEDLTDQELYLVAQYGNAIIYSNEDTETE